MPTQSVQWRAGVLFDIQQLSATEYVEIKVGH